MKILRAFYMVNGVKPKRIIFYRDGVSEGQFPEVQPNRCPVFNQACVTISQLEIEFHIPNQGYGASGITIFLKTALRSKYG